VLSLYRQAEKNPANFVKTGHSKFWNTKVSESQVYSTGVCYGCTVVVVASGKGIYLGHFQEEVGSESVFNDPTSSIFIEKVSGPFEDSMIENNEAFANQRPYMVMAMPYMSYSGSGFKYRAAVQALEEGFRERYLDGTLRTQGYRQRFIKDEALDKTAAGKVVVQWLPPSSGGDARLIVHVEDNVLVDAHYNADGRLVS
jgi:hypothetical protein